MAGDLAWVGEWLIQFLKSPVWTAPVQGFMDLHCDIFEDNDEEENKLEYTIKHKMFCELVDKLLLESLEELGVTQEQFLDVVGNSANEEVNRLVKEYLLSMDDFLTFRKMMEKRNIELELEAVCALETADTAEDHLLEMAIKASVMDQSVDKKENQAEDAALQLSLAQSLAEEEERQRALEEEIRQKVADSAEQKKRMEEAQKAHAERVRELESQNLAARIEAIQGAPEVKEVRTSLPDTSAVAEGAKEPEKPADPEKPAVKPAQPVVPAAAPPSAHQAPSPAEAAEQQKPAEAPKAAAPVAAPAAPVKPLEKPQLAPLGGAKTGGAAKDPFAKKSALPGLPPGIAPGSRPTYEQLKTAVVEQTEKKVAEVNPSAPEPPKPVQPSEDDMKRREEYLRAQRDKLIQQRQAKRHNELSEYVKDKTGKEPPPLPAPTTTTPTKQEDAMAEMRRALAKKVKEDLLS